MGNAGSSSIISLQRSRRSHPPPPPPQQSQQQITANRYVFAAATPLPSHYPNPNNPSPPPPPYYHYHQPYDHHHRPPLVDPAHANWVGGHYPCGPAATPYVEHQKAVTIRNDVNLKKDTLRVEPDEENPGKFVVTFTFDATVAGRYYLCLQV